MTDSESGRAHTVVSAIVLVLAVALAGIGRAMSGQHLADPHGLTERLSSDSTTELTAAAVTIAGLLFGLMFVGQAAAAIRRRFGTWGLEGAIVFAVAGAGYIALTMAAPVFLAAMTAGGVTLSSEREPAFDVVRAVVLVTGPVGLGCAGIAALGVAVAAFAGRAPGEGTLSCVAGVLLIILTIVASTDSSIDGYVGVMTAGSVIVVGYAIVLVIASARLLAAPPQQPQVAGPSPTG